ncbi:MAG: hypothetical protein A2Z06_04990 [Candidatus Glassbacteria bacterium RBG_16_58_8]|uniref:Uncharacterized protein n=1 Tax=Candidatus Glassbacteria bacterium RBG_16_58_8 TaxID=1817866 RepID=A0A1F5YD22_9BACT|nr:MAG: hypothetical protein A2Z06_04990 [Candidatus Glassbacteria bacterium RBG_16_58_8]
MLLYVGIYHSLLIRELSKGRIVAWGMGILGLLTGNLFYSLVAGLGVEWIGRRWRASTEDHRPDDRP